MHLHPHSATAVGHSHDEKHVKTSEILKDVVIGMADGLTVPFALAAGLSGAVSTTSIIVTAGVAEIAAGTIAMGLGGYLAAKTQADHYRAEYAREEREIVELPHVEEAEVADIVRDLGVAEAEVPIVVNAIKADPKRWVQFMMRMELGLEKPDPKRVLQSPLTIGGAYVVGGLLPLLPYMLMDAVNDALPISIIITLTALFIFGALKGKFTGMPVWRSAAQTALIGGAAAAAAFGIANLISE